MSVEASMVAFAFVDCHCCARRCRVSVGGENRKHCQQKHVEKGQLMAVVRSIGRLRVHRWPPFLRGSAECCGCRWKGVCQYELSDLEHPRLSWRKLSKSAQTSIIGALGNDVGRPSPMFQAFLECFTHPSTYQTTQIEAHRRFNGRLAAFDSLAFLVNTVELFCGPGPCQSILRPGKCSHFQAFDFRADIKIFRPLTVHSSKVTVPTDCLG